MATNLLSRAVEVSVPEIPATPSSQRDSAPPRPARERERMWNEEPSVPGAVARELASPPPKPVRSCGESALLEPRAPTKKELSQPLSRRRAQASWFQVSIL